MERLVPEALRAQRAKPFDAPVHPERDWLVLNERSNVLLFFSRLGTSGSTFYVSPFFATASEVGFARRNVPQHRRNGKQLLPVPPQNTAVSFCGELAVGDRRPAVDQDPIHPLAIGVRLLVGGPFPQRGGVYHQHVRIGA